MTSLHIKTQGLGFFLHGAGCFCAFLFTLRPFLGWCAPNFLIVRFAFPVSTLPFSSEGVLMLLNADVQWEFSTIFLNAHWLFDKLKMTGSKAQMVNGVLLVYAVPLSPLSSPLLSPSSPTVTY